MISDHHSHLGIKPVVLNGRRAVLVCPESPDEKTVICIGATPEGVASKIALDEACLFVDRRKMNQSRYFVVSDPQGNPRLVYSRAAAKSAEPYYVGSVVFPKEFAP